MTVSSQQSPAATLLVDNLDGATSFDITPTGRIYITESGRHRLLITDLQGSRIDSLGVQGSGDYRFDFPSSVDATNGLKIYVADKQNRRIQLYDRRHQFLSSIDEGSIRDRRRFIPHQLAVNVQRELFVLDRDALLIHKFDPNGVFEWTLDPRQFRVRSADWLLVFSDEWLIGSAADQQFYRFDRNGRFTGFGAFSEPVHAVTAGGSSMWTATETAIQERNLRGDILRSIPFDRAPAVRHIQREEQILYLLTDRQLFQISLSL
ncbi:MAG: hypothetical protein ACNA78_00045 [Balneolaceae bacterium]